MVSATSLKRGVNEIDLITLVVEELFHWSTQQDFNWQFFCLILIRWLLPLKLLRIHPADVLDDFHADTKWLKRVAIDNMQLRATAELTSELVKGWLEIVLPKENARQV